MSLMFPTTLQKSSGGLSQRPRNWVYQGQAVLALVSVSCSSLVPSSADDLATLTLFLSPHICTLSTHSALARAKRTSFPFPALAASLVVLCLSLPAALVPYYLMSTPTGMVEGVIAAPRKSGVLARFPDQDLSINVARLFMAAMVLGSCNMWILRGRDTILRSIGVDRGEMIKAGRWVGLGYWAIIVALVCFGGWVSEKLEVLGVIATIAISWLLPCKSSFDHMIIRGKLTRKRYSSSSHSTSDPHYQ